MLRIHFCDNDFSTEIYNACKEFMYIIANGYERYEAEKQLKNNIEKYGIEKLRKSIILSSYGFYIISKANRLFQEINFDFADQKDIIQYFEEKIKIEEVSIFNKNDDNSETCYIDFYNLQVYLV